MRIAVEARPVKIEGRFMDRLALTCEKLGHEVERFTTFPTEATDLIIEWGVTPSNLVHPVLHAELGWLPRWHYQLSHTGINARHHLAGQIAPPLTEDQRWKLQLHLEDARSGTGRPPEWSYMDVTAQPPEGLPESFILVPFQMPQDLNMADVPGGLREAQQLIDHLANWDPPHPLIFKQHPHSQAGYQLALALRRPQDRIVAHLNAPVYAYLRHPGCKAVVTLNSNVAHDALLLEVPVIALGRGFWPNYPETEYGAIEGRLPPREWLSHQIEADEAGIFRERYLYHLMKSQWSLEDALSEQRVAEAIEDAVR